jgi:methionyl-tRNA synthetase
MKCIYCNADLRWNNDFDTEDTYPDSEYSILSMYQCDECDTWYEVYHNKKEEYELKKSKKSKKKS